MSVRFRAGDKEFQASVFLFDKDGTLITFDHWFRVMEERARRLVRRLGLTARGAAALADFLGVDRGQPGHWGIIPLPRPEAEAATAQFLSELTGLSLPELTGLVREIFAEVDADFPFERHLRPVPGAEALLRAVRRAGGKVAVVTHDLASAARQHLRALGWEELVDGVVGLDVCPLKKPAPDPLLCACALVGRRPEEAVMVGDMPWDLQAGRAAGCRGTVGVLTGLGQAEELAPWADVVLADLREARIEK
ncbi:MAG: HAD family hydrolase [Candidatus Bipolaricaulaceae bacterium]